MAAIPCATYQAVNVHSKLRRRHKSDSDVNFPLSRPFTPLAGLASAESTTSSSSNSPSMPSSPTNSGNGTFFGNFFQLSQKMKNLTNGLNNKPEQPPYSVGSNQSDTNAGLSGTSISKQ